VVPVKKHALRGVNVCKLAASCTGFFALGIIALQRKKYYYWGGHNVKNCSGRKEKMRRHGLPKEMSVNSPKNKKTAAV
jgi:hypothetical protein